jgi:hypothetical protein
MTQSLQRITLTPTCYGGIHTTIIRERVHTESWEHRCKLKSFLLRTHCQRYFTDIHVHKARQALYTRCDNLLHTAHPGSQPMGVEVNGPSGWCTVVVGSCSRNSQSSPVALLQIWGSVRGLWYALMCVFLCDERCVLAWSGVLAYSRPVVCVDECVVFVMPRRCVLARSGALACLTFPLCTV